MKKIFLLAALFLMVSTNAHATFFARTAGGAWATIGTWSTTSSAGASSGTIPTATDDVVFDSGSTGAVTLDSATADVCKTLTMQSASNKLTFTAADKCIVSGSVTFFTGQGTNISGTGTLNMIVTGTLTTNGVTIPGALTFGGTSQTYTLAGALSTTGNIVSQGTTLVTIATGGNNITTAAQVGIGSSTTFTGAGTVSAATLSLSNASTLTYVSDWTITGGLTKTATASTFTLTSASNVINVGGGLDVLDGNITGSGTVVLNGTGTIDTLGPTLGVGCNLTINTSGTITVSGTFIFNTSSGRVFKFTSGTITGGTIKFGTLGATLDTATGGAIASDVQFVSATYTFNSLFTTTGTVSIINFQPTFAGTAGMTCGTLTIGGAQTNKTITFPASQTLTVTTALNLNSDLGGGFVVSLVSGTSSTAFNLKYQGTLAAEKVFNITFTDVDASTSTSPIYNYDGGTLTRTTNIYNTDGSSFPAVGDVRSGTSYAGGAKTGTLAVSSGGGSYTFSS